MTTQESIWMTESALTALRAELAELEGRVSELSDLERLRAAEVRVLVRSAVVDRKPDDGLVEPGMQVTVRFEGDGSEVTFLLGERSVADAAAGLDVFSPSSPLGAAIDGRRVGDVASYDSPAGRQHVSVVAATPFG